MKKSRVRILASLFISGAALLAQTAVTYDPVAVARGVQVAPVTLNYGDRDKDQVAYGSYLVNAVGGCNDCHTNPSYRSDGDPFKGQKKAVNTAGYLSGGTAFGPFFSRNLTPSVAGPVTGSLTNFKNVIRTGTDLRKLHPQISPLLQVMPWPVYQDMTDKDLEAIFAYLSSIPCVEGGPEEKANRCGQATTPTTAVAEPKNATVQAFQIALDGTKSTSADGKALKYFWESAPGSPVAAITGADSATPSVQFSVSRVPYTFKLTVTDSTGKTATDTVTINYTR